MIVETLEAARWDIRKGRTFYEDQQVGLGRRFARSVLREIEGLAIYGGIHSLHYQLHRAQCRDFNVGIFYRVRANTVQVLAVLDLRRDPHWLQRRLRARRDLE